jgi:hypothetical protein
MFCNYWENLIKFVRPQDVSTLCCSRVVDMNIFVCPTSLFLILEWQHIRWSRSPNLRKMHDFGTGNKILFRYQNLWTYTVGPWLFLTSSGSLVTNGVCSSGSPVTNGVWWPGGTRECNLCAMSIRTRSKNLLKIISLRINNDITPSAVHCVIIATIWEDCS